MADKEALLRPEDIGGAIRDDDDVPQVYKSLNFRSIQDPYSHGGREDDMISRYSTIRADNLDNMLSGGLEHFYKKYNHLSRKINITLPTPEVRFENLSFSAQVPLATKASDQGTVGMYLRKVLAPWHRHPTTTKLKSAAGPPGGGGEPGASKAPAKKSSKRASASAAVSDPPSNAATMGGPSPLSTAGANDYGASPVPRLRDVPRTPVAEPKSAGDALAAAAESKPRASKKRTADTRGPSMPSAADADTPPADTPAAAAAAAAAAKQDADAEREKQAAAAARREAKRQRAKELEDAKRREELAKQVLEDARRAEEARQREQRRQQELAALNANAEECQEEEEAQGDYDDDGFENYDDDFEDDSRPPEKPSAVPQTKPQSKAKATSGGGSSNRDDVLSPLELKKIQQALQAESKELSTSRPSSSSSKAGDSSSSHNQEQQVATEAKKKKGSATSTSIASSIAGLKQSLDPRAKRVKEVLDARKFEVEKFNLFHQAPLSEQETYLSSLRRGHVRQVAMYTNDGAKAMPTQTKFPAGVDKSMHFPDDIGLDSASSTTIGNNNSRDGEDDSVSAHSTVRFFKFLESAAYACELLAEGNAAAAELELEESKSSTRKSLAVSRNTSLSQQLVFPNKRFDDPLVEALLEGRDIVAMRYSPCASNILVICYGPQETSQAGKELLESVALLKYKGVSCIWDVNQPHQVLYVLKNEGLISAVSLSPNRELITLAGTEDGSIHVWDLRKQPYRSSSEMHESGRLSLCSPTYSTCGIDYKSPSQHASTIVALEVIVQTIGSYGSGNNNPSSGTFQFGSMDDRGIVIIWSLIEFEAGEDALLADKCVEIGGRVKMVMNTLIDTQQQYMVAKPPLRAMERSSSLRLSSAKASASRSGNAALDDGAFSVGPIATVFKFFPHDPNQFVFGTRSGLIYRGHRFEKTEQRAVRAVYRRNGGRGAQCAIAAGVVCIAFHPFSPEYFLVGYEDGGICMFQHSSCTCLRLWEDVAFGVSVSSLQWSTSRPGVFFASFSNAQVLVWDLTEQTNAPVLSHSIPALETSSPVDLASSLYPLVLSSEMIRASRPTIAIRSGASPPFQFELHELSQELAARSRDEGLEVKALFSRIL